MKRRNARLAVGIAALALVACCAACSRGDKGGASKGEGTPKEESTSKGEGASKEGSAAMTIRLTSTAFEEGKSIPRKHTCDGEDVSPPLVWSKLPDGAKSIALICDDPDAPMGTWVHWVLYDMPVTATELAEGVPKRETIANGAKQGVNDFKRVGYGGPCPPPGHPHRYFFKLYALDNQPNLKPGVKKRDLLNAMEGHIVAEGQLMGTYKR